MAHPQQKTHPGPAPRMTGEQLIESIYEAHETFLSGRFPIPQPLPRDRVWASQWRPCTRQMALDLLHPEDREAFDLNAMSRMTNGAEREESLRARFLQFGKLADPPFVMVHGQQRFEIKGRSLRGGQRTVISGKIDGRLMFEGQSVQPVIEFKSGMAIQRIERKEDFQRSRWTRAMPMQLLAYMYASSTPLGLLILDQAGGFRIIPFELEEHLEEVEQFLASAERACAARFDEMELPAFIDDREECRHCSHLGKSCHPPIDFGEGIVTIDDPELLAAAEIREAQQEAASEYRDADSLLKKRLRGIERGQLGDFEVRGSWSPRKVFDIPKEIAEQYMTVNEKGTFRLTIERNLEP